MRKISVKRQLYAVIMKVLMYIAVGIIILFFIDLYQMISIIMNIFKKKGRDI